MRILLICIISSIFIGLSLTSCTVYEIDLQQGNVLEDEAVTKIKKGMTKQQIQFILGSPIIKDVFHPNRWDYVHTFRPGKGTMSLRSITIFFENDKMVRYTDTDPVITDPKSEDQKANSDSKS